MAMTGLLQPIGDLPVTLVPGDARLIGGVLVRGNTRRGEGEKRRERDREREKEREREKKKVRERQREKVRLVKYPVIRFLLDTSFVFLLHLTTVTYFAVQDTLKAGLLLRRQRSEVEGQNPEGHSRCGGGRTGPPQVWRGTQGLA